MHSAMVSILWMQLRYINRRDPAVRRREGNFSRSVIDRMGMFGAEVADADKRQQCDISCRSFPERQSLDDLQVEIIVSD